MISSLMALLNLIFAFFLSCLTSIKFFLNSTIQVVNRLRGDGATFVLCMFLERGQVSV